MILLKIKHYMVFALIFLFLFQLNLILGRAWAETSIEHEFSEEMLEQASEEQDYDSYPVDVLKALLEKYEFLKLDFIIYELIGDHYLWGYDFAEYNPEIAYKYYKRAAEIPMELEDYFGSEHEVTHTRIMVKLAGMYLNGLGTALDEEKAIFWLNKARNIYGAGVPGSSMANIKLGSIYNGRKYDLISEEFAKEFFQDAKMRGKEYPIFLDLVVEQAEGTYAYEKLPCSNLLKDRPSLLEQPFQKYAPIPEFIQFGVAVDKINGVNTQEKTIDVSYYSLERFNDYRLNFNPINFGTSLCMFEQQLLKNSLAGKEPLYLWDPNIVANNSMTEILDRKSNLFVYNDGTVQKFSQKRASFDVDMDLRGFPFDVQKFRLTFSPARNPAYSIRLDSKEIDEHHFLDTVNTKIADGEWILISSNGKLDERHENGYLKSFYEYELTVKRNPTFYIVNLFIPVLTIFMISISHFWFLNEKLDAKVTVVLSSLVAVIAYQFITKDDLPKLSYITNLDITITATIIMIALNAVSIAINQHMITTGNEDKAARINTFSRIAQPALWLFLVFSINVSDFLRWYTTVD